MPVMQMQPALCTAVFQQSTKHLDAVKAMCASLFPLTHRHTQLAAAPDHHLDAVIVCSSAP